MRTETVKKKAGPPQIVKLDKALKLAEQWVNNMSGSLEHEPVEVEPEGRPPKLGLGAKVSRQSKVGPSNDPVERKLYAKLDVGKRKASKSIEESTSYGRDESNEEEEEGDLESRSSVFTKKRAVPPTPTLQAKKKQK
ncbi:hypothetical protein SLE2022_180320 [Rubroshorea leprosula]